ncbi:MAG: hypothetical protein RJB66_891 [Pseudomonadota bacterium]
MNYEAILDFITEKSQDVPSCVAGAAQLTALESLIIYRNDYLARTHSALGANFPILWKIIGDDSFLELSQIYRRQYPSSTWNLNHYGEQLPALVNSEHNLHLRSDFPFICDLAALEWASQEYFNEPPLSQPLQNLPSQEQDLAQLRIAPNLRIFQSQFNVPEIYRAAQQGKEVLPIDWNRPSFYFLSKENFIVQLEDLTKPQCALLVLWKKNMTIEQTLADLETAPPEITNEMLTELGPLLVRLFRTNLLFI